MGLKIGVMGLLGSGKSTFGDMLLERLKVENPEWIEASYAAPIKELCCDVLNVDLDYINNRETKELNIPFQYNFEMEEYLYDFLDSDLQFDEEQLNLGLSLMREKFKGLKEISPRTFLQFFGTDVVRGVDPEAWIKLLHRKCGNRPAIVTDVRFDNEYVDINFLVCRFLDVARPEHSSEHLAWDLQFDPEVSKYSKVLEVYNTGTIEMLKKSVDSVILYLKDEHLI